MDAKKADREKRDKRFAREELGDLLRLFSSLGITVALAIVGFFWLGVWGERRLANWGYATGKWPRIAMLLFGLGLAIYWAYLRIARHLEKYEKDGAAEETRDDGNGVS